MTSVGVYFEFPCGLFKSRFLLLPPMLSGIREEESVGTAHAPLLPEASCVLEGFELTGREPVVVSANSLASFEEASVEI